MVRRPVPHQRTASARSRRIVSFVPMVMFAILFGLSMDYEVFLLSRIREEYLVDHDTVQSVTTGIRVSARVITFGRARHDRGVPLVSC